MGFVHLELILMDNRVEAINLKSITISFLALGNVYM